MTPQEALNRANAARRLLDDPVLKEALEVMGSEVMEAWLACPVRDVEGREHLWRMAVTTRKFRDILRGTMEAGKLAAEQIRRADDEKLSLVRRAASAFNSWR